MMRLSIDATPFIPPHNKQEATGEQEATIIQANPSWQAFRPATTSKQAFRPATTGKQATTGEQKATGKQATTGGATTDTITSYTEAVNKLLAGAPPCIGAPPAYNTSAGDHEDFIKKINYMKEELLSDIRYFNGFGDDSLARKLERLINRLSEYIKPLLYNDCDALANNTVCLTCNNPKTPVLIGNPNYSANVCIGCYSKSACKALNFQKKCKICMAIWDCGDAVPDNACCEDYQVISIFDRNKLSRCKCVGEEQKKRCQEIFNHYDY